jgi:hypothetical protein
VLSLWRKGQCWDNALAESFFASLKGELTDNQAWPTRAGARRAIVEYSSWYNDTSTAPSATSAPPNSRLQPETKDSGKWPVKLSALSIKAGQPHPPGPELVLLLCWPQEPRSAVAPAPGPGVPAPRREDRSPGPPIITAAGLSAPAGLPA